ncbi:hypothetical protein EZS27_021984 [termite gut metagenome]|uniref:Uncharacterized protein n=1 Tax=termite gut metagenome TaxID=433724 RepID=A0A5J4R682_9ZZZZ
MAFELNGLYWHNEYWKKDKNYHLNKTEKCENKGIKLIHIFEDEWYGKKEIVKSNIKNLLSCNERIIHEIECDIQELNHKESKHFLNKNHIEGDVESEHRFGLIIGNKIVSVIVFGNKTEDNSYELLRHCNKLNTSVIGNNSKLLNHFIETVKPKEITVNVDRRWGSGEQYGQLGFKFIENTEVNHYYVQGVKRKKPSTFESEIEHEFMLNKGIYRIYDCGNKLYKLSL